MIMSFKKQFFKKTLNRINNTSMLDVTSTSVEYKYDLMLTLMQVSSRKSGL